MATRRAASTGSDRVSARWKTAFVRERRGAVEPAPGDQQAARRSGILAAAAQEKSIAQTRLVLAAPRNPRTGGGGLERQAAPPGPGKGRGPHVGPDPAIEPCNPM
jgi:hypothetical protein